MRVVLLIVSCALILISMLQSGKSEGLGAFTGSGDINLFQNVKERGAEKTLSRITMVLIIAFFALVLIIRHFGL